MFLGLNKAFAEMPASTSTTLSTFYSPISYPTPQPPIRPNILWLAFHSRASPVSMVQALTDPPRFHPGKPGSPPLPLCRARASLAAWAEGSSMAPPAMAEGDGLVSVDYEVFGKVQGVFFRKYTQAEGKKLGLVGWVQNTDDGTVQGQIQGPVVKVRQLQEWLQKKGSPKSHIDRAEFHNEKKIARLEYRDFKIVK